MRAILVMGLLVAGCGTRPLDHDDGCQVGNPRPISDGFQGTAVDSRCWSAQVGAVSVEGGALVVNGDVAGYNFAEMAVPGGAGDFALRARVQLRGTGPHSSMAVGWRSQGTNATLAFLVPPAAASWHGLIDNTAVPLQEQMAVATGYSELELARAGNLATFSVDGAVIDSREYDGDLSASPLRISASGGGSVLVDSIELH